MRRRLKGIVASRDADVGALDIPVYVEQLLKLAGIKSVRDLEYWTEVEVLAIDGFDTRALAELKHGLARDGYHIGSAPDTNASCYRF